MTKIKADAANTVQLISKRSLSRLIAAQTLYQYQYNDQEGDILEIMDEVIDNYMIDPNKEEIQSYRKKVDIGFLRNLVSGVILVLEKLDSKITSALGNSHDINNIDDVMLQIIRLGTFELQFTKDSPVKVIINEYVDISSSFYDTKKVGFVNAVLDKISKNIER